MTLLTVKKLRAKARLPEYRSSGAAGLDLYVCLDDSLSVPAGTTVTVPTGVAMAIPPGLVGLVRDRSSMAIAGLVTVAGVIDSDYRGEILVAVHNTGPRDLILQPGDRIAQILILPCPPVRVEESSELPDTERGSGGFGSTGR